MVQLLREGYTSAVLWTVLFVLSISNILTWQTRLMFVASVVEDRGGGVVRLAGAVSQSLPSLCLGCDQCDHSRYGPGVMIRDSSQNTTFLISH